MNPLRTAAVLILIILLCATPFYPTAAFLAAALLGMLIVCLVIPGLRPFSRTVLGVTPGHPFRTCMKTVLVALYAMIFCVAGFGSAAFHEGMEEARRREAIAAEAQKRRREEADAQSQVLLSEALEAIENDDLRLASDTLRQILALPDVSLKQTPARLSMGIKLINSEDALRRSLAALDDDDFQNVLRAGSLPESLKTGNAVLDAKILGASSKAAPTVIAEREERAAEAAAAEQERARAEEQARVEQARAQQDRETAERQLLESRHARLLELLNSLNQALGVQLFDSLSVTREGGRSWRATVTVTNVWHIRHKQVRLQDAQTLWEAWATIASPDDPDRAFLKLVDYNGNPVGGSGWLAGSLISVPD